MRDTFPKPIQPIPASPVYGLTPRSIDRTPVRKYNSGTKETSGGAEMGDSAPLIYYLIPLPEEVCYHIRDNLVFINTAFYGSLDDFLKSLAH